MYPIIICDFNATFITDPQSVHMKKIGLLFLGTLFALLTTAQGTSSGRDTTGGDPSPSGGCQVSQILFSSPQDASACPGATVLFIASGGFCERSYWEVTTNNGISWTTVAGTEKSYPSLANPAADTLTLTNVSLSMNNHIYRWCLYMGCRPTKYSNPATLNVSGTTVIHTQPLSMLNTCAGAPVSFPVGATGGVLRYQWQVSTDGGNNFENILFATAATLHIPAADMGMHNNRYRCLIFNPCYPAVISDTATLTVSSAIPVITTQPLSTNGCVGQGAALTIGVGGVPLIEYQWQYKTSSSAPAYTDVAGANAAVLSLNPTPAMNGYQYRCRIGGSCSYVYSAPATLTTYQVPQFTTRLGTQQKCMGDTVQLNPGAVVPVTDNFITAFLFQWQRSTDNGATFTDIGNATGAIYRFTVTPGVVGEMYRCKVYNPCYTVYSDTAALVLNVPVTIATQPVNTGTCIGSVAYFSVVAAGSLSYNPYQWEVSTDGGVSYSANSGGISSGNRLILENVQSSMHNNRYRCRLLSNCMPAVYTDAAVLQITPKPYIGADTVTRVICDFCTANLLPLYSSAGFSSAVWNSTTPAAVLPGKYNFTVTDPGGCKDTATAFVNFEDGYTLGICNSSDALIGRMVSSVTGSTYLWQVSLSGTDNGYATFYPFGTTTPVTTPYLTDAQTGIQAQGNYVYCNTKFRCLVNNTTYSIPYTIRRMAFWTGAANDGKWTTPGNWGCGAVPSSCDHVVINAGNVLINADATVQTLTVKPGVNISIAEGKTLRVIR